MTWRSFRSFDTHPAYYPSEIRGPDTSLFFISEMSFMISSTEEDTHRMGRHVTSEVRFSPWVSDLLVLAT